MRLVPGSSPLTRGKLEASGECEGLAGLIPAHAGKTRRRQTDEEEAEAHPRSRGENLVVQKKGMTSTGSSPLTRGKPADRALSGKWSGLIPAHAGKTHQKPRNA